MCVSVLILKRQSAGLLDSIIVFSKQQKLSFHTLPFQKHVIWDNHMTTTQVHTICAYIKRPNKVVFYLN